MSFPNMAHNNNRPELPGRLHVAYYRLTYFFLRLINPVISEPKPSNPSKGSGEAVWGSFCPLALAF